MRRNLLPAASAFLLTSLLLPAASFGWGHEGHKIVATIADARLTPQAKAAVKDLLGNATMADVSTWPDEIRRDRKETGPWHYVDIPYQAATFDEARDGQDGNNIIDKIPDFVKQLTDPTLPKQQRLEALKFVIHFLGDIHQPLHCVERNHDKGGNTRLTFFLNEPKAVNLHAVWDFKILEHAMGNTPMTVYAAGLSARVSHEQLQQWQGGTPEQWAEESHKLAVDVTYNGIPTDGPPPKLDEQYVARSTDVINQQLEKAGVRLAWVLNNAFRNAPATSTADAVPPTTRPAPAGAAD